MNTQKIKSCLNFIFGIVEETKDRIETEFVSKVSICAASDEETEKTISDLRSALIELNSIKLEVNETSTLSIRIVEEVRTDFTDEQNLTHIDVWFKGEEEGEVVAVLDRDTGKTIWKNNQFRRTPLVLEAIDEILETIPFSISDTWTIHDVLEVCEELKVGGYPVKLTEEMAKEVLLRQQKGLDTEQGITFYSIQSYAEDVWLENLIETA